MKIIFFGLVIFGSISSFANNEVKIKLTKNESTRVIKALLSSEVPAKVDGNKRSIEFTGIDFSKTNGHDCDDSGSVYCGFGNPIRSRNEALTKEIVQLDSTLESVLRPHYTKLNIENGDAAAGTSYWTYGSMKCNWVVDAEKYSLIQANCTNSIKSTQ